MPAKVASYLDANAGAFLCPDVAEALLPFLGVRSSLVPNPSSIHSHGRTAKRALAEAREAIASSLDADPEQLVLTSSGTEANQLVIRSVLEANLAQGGRPHWITTPVEHDSVLQMVSWFEKAGGSVSYLPVDTNGAPEVSRLRELFRSEKDQASHRTVLVSAVWVNNETGVVTDVAALSALTRECGVPLHLDGAQAWGKLSFSVKTLGAQFLTFSAHKIGGLAGSGGVWISSGHGLNPTILGKQEKGRRGGTENLLGIVAMGAAARKLNPVVWSQKVSLLRERLESAICDQIAGTKINGGGAPRVANTLNLSFDGVEGDGLVIALDMAGYSVSSGSACASGVLEPSHVLQAMGKTKSQAMAAVRVSLSPNLSWDTLEGFIHALDSAVKRVRNAATA